ncbi:sugar phosphate isomerase/epimerase family protein (plasmid) [Herbiconiux sp. KACC 21604]|uniref:sugar phosphate isomerase/epimerase family protein n=1 Tax=unclassified Herbiconiux TaxID=2618217 RepID=UPI001492E208|nr:MULTISPECIES: sugar phosphate isomerase/epimerase family protein [unclassified Herbiconiux]QJU56329.1 sugar phosphate isomerase/epimerase [Herbiconiux sp. SALV-R1]WPO88836.1 sugar phosphate isomerase/epimerase family protein [Herbiconiux sp. KACC 21604]
MIIAGHTLGTPGRDLPEALRLFKNAGLDAAEVIYQDDYSAAITPSDPRAPRAAAAIADAEGMPIIALTPYTTSINSLDQTSWHAGIDEFKRCIAAAHEVGATRVRVYAGAWHPGDADHSAHWDRLAAALRQLSADAAQAGVVLCVENHFGTMTQTASDTARLVREVDSPAVRVLYDQANLTFTHDEDWTDAFAMQGDLIGHVHVKDLVFKDPTAPFRASDTARVKPEERAIRSRVVGTGVLPWPDVIGELVQRGYDGALTLEYEYRWHPQDLPEPEIGFTESARALRAILEAKVPAHER